MPEFIPGLKLGELFYEEAVRPVLQTSFPDLKYSAALIGSGSEVPGFDTPQSTDHHWGPRVILFLGEADYQQYNELIFNILSEKLPHRFHGYSTSFGPPDEIGVRVLVDKEDGPVDHGVEITTIASFFESYLGFNPYKPVEALDWLTFAEQKLLTVTAGKVFYDGLGELEPIRQKFSYYPPEVWLYLLCSQWNKISQEEAFMARCGDVGDDLGSQIVAARLVRELMKLCFLMERQYAPYTKWFGTGFSRLKCASQLNPVFQQVLKSNGWKEREQHLANAYRLVAQMHNESGITRPISTGVSYYHNRPYLVIHAGRFADEIRATITDEEIKRLSFTPIGGVDQFIDSTDVLSNPARCAKLKNLYS